MSSQLVEVVSFPTSVTVPDPGEKVNAASVRVFSQAHADREQWLRQQHITNRTRMWHEQSSAFATNSIEDAGALSSLGLWLFGQRSDRVVTSRGYPNRYSSNTLTTAGGKSGLSRLFCDNGDDLVMFTVDSSTVVATDPDIWVYDGTSFTRKALAPFNSTTQFRTAQYLASLDRWVYMGNEGGTVVPAVWTSDNDGTSWTSRTIAAASAERVYDSAVGTDLASGDVLIMGVGTDTGGTNNVAWTSADGATWSNNAITGATDVRMCARSDILDTWMVLSLSGAAATAYKSTDDGANWSSAGALPGDITAIHGLVGAGALFVALAKSDYGQDLFISSDAGATWEPAALLELSSGPSPVAAGVAPLKYLQGRFLALFTDATNGLLVFSG